jgi:hypothetical protein
MVQDGRRTVDTVERDQNEAECISSAPELSVYSGTAKDFNYRLITDSSMCYDYDFDSRKTNRNS